MTDVEKHRPLLVGLNEEMLWIEEVPRTLGGELEHGQEVPGGRGARDGRVHPIQQITV